MKPEQIAQMIDHTILKAATTSKDIDKLCKEAIENNFYSVCVNPYYTEYAAQKLGQSNVKVCTVIGFPLGANTSRIKAKEAKLAVSAGASEIDMVINIGALKNKNYLAVAEEIYKVVEASGKALVKVILETCYLDEAEIIKACELAVDAGADYVKTSTGFGSAGAKVEHIALMRKTVGPDIGVKASGGVRDLKTTMAMIEAGASRIGTSSGINIIKEMK